MHATGDLSGRRGQAFAMEIKPILLPVRCPIFLKTECQLGGGDTESTERQDHGANTDMRFGAFGNMPTPRTLKDRRREVPFGSNSLKHRVQVIPQLDDCGEGHALVPLGAQPLHHVGKPHSLCVTCGHV
jgi:hypothetical protein